MNKMPRIALLDYARFIAALMVVFHHYFYNGIHNGKITSITYTDYISAIAKYGNVGVDFFFIISGYVIFYSTYGKTASEFVTSRLLRLYPAYWFAVLLTSMVVYFWGYNTIMKVSITQIFVNFTMLQEFLKVPNIDGVYWTLTVELKFYILVTIMMFFFNQNKIHQFFKIWPLFILIFNLIGWNGGFFDSKFAFFSLGTLFAMYRHERGLSVFFPFVIAIASCVKVIAIKVETVQDGVVYFSCMAIFIGFFLLINRDKYSSLKLYKSELLGSLTYPLYLIHAHIGYLVLSKLATENSKLFVYTILILSLLLLSFLVNFYIEKSMKNFWMSFFTVCVLPLKKFELIMSKFNS